MGSGAEKRSRSGSIVPLKLFPHQLLLSLIFIIFFHIYHILGEYNWENPHKTISICQCTCINTAAGRALILKLLDKLPVRKLTKAASLYKNKNTVICTPYVGIYSTTTIIFLNLFCAGMDTSTSGNAESQGAGRIGLEGMDTLIKEARTSSGSISSYASASSATTPAAPSSISQQIRKIKNAAAVPCILGQHDTCRTISYGYLATSDTAGDEDHRYKMAHYRELYDKNRNIATSFDPSSLMCGNCFGGPHHILVKDGRSKPSAFILRDQCFPVALPAACGKECLAIIRVEDATINDLVTTFMRSHANATLPLAQSLY